ncbi:family 78 glycoside hydrolase catalytic domain [Actinospica sp. MGRD01-02]|uniref:alpha-L-rhamnosidase n=1 Tax=Actinospica acidithermotolerans TaxID=2828514 RepID=A0A941E7R4_9ACTN|nr:alpha-L-rhamnosidase [Actinospica acidithermotolerans]MBR7826591.1 family 78 glycoside hydrolase catalytic domain [Actinospica acidithermotolerans]
MVMAQRPAEDGIGRRRFIAVGGATTVGGLSALMVPGAVAHADTASSTATDTASSAAAGSSNAAGAAFAPLRIDTLRTASMTSPMGVDLPAPTLSWQLVDDARRTTAGPTYAAQTAYQVQVATDEQLLRSGKPDLWDSGRVMSSQNCQIAYGGRPVSSRAVASWRVRVWDADGRVTDWSAPATWELGLLSSSDWSASWIGNAEWEAPQPLTVTLTSAQTARYVRLTVTDLGRPAAPLGDPAFQPQLQMAEFELFDSSAPGVNVALGAAVTASESITVAGQWAPEYLTDGKISSVDAPHGYQSAIHPATDVSATPILLTFDLGQDRTFDTAAVYQLWDAPSQWGVTPNYPRTFTIGVSESPNGPFTTVGTMKKDDKPYPPSSMHNAPAALPLFARQFTVPNSSVDKARLYISCSGIHIATVNGRPVTDNVLEPPVSNVLREVQYATYDVTNLIRHGQNSVGVELGGGTWDIFNTLANPSRYIKATAGFGPPRLIAQLELTYPNGRTQIVATDGAWQTSLGATTFSNWYGGEDYDARREQAGWDSLGADLTGGEWKSAVVTGKPASGTALSGRLMPGVQIVESGTATAVTNPSSGIYVFDYGVNAAGWPELTVNAPAGTVVTLRPGERLKNGLIDQSTTGTPIYDTYTAAGTGDEVWHPRFMYHGLRYLQVEGLPQAPATTDATRHVLRAANAESATFTCSDELLNSIHTIINRALQSNMFSTLTDCPHREKLGWLDDIGLIFDVAARNYDVAAMYRKIVRDMSEAQSEDGLVPTTAPELAQFAGAYRDDANWGGSIILAPWQMYRFYGDLQTVRDYYPAMQKYLGYLATQSSGYLLNDGLGDWITLNTTTPVGVTASYAYMRLATTMVKIANLLGNGSDAATYQQLATNISAAFNAKYYNASTASYSSGSQACNALALDGGLVPAADRGAVLSTLIATIRANGNHLDVGEVALPAVFRVLARAGRHDVIHDIATLTSSPSYGYQVVSGSTSLAEDWGGLGTNGSQNHWMLGALDAWFTGGVGGIDQSEDSVAFSDLVIAPAVVGSLTSAAATYQSPQGRISTSWQTGPGSISLDASVPANTTATVALPLAAAGGSAAQVSATDGAKLTGNDGTNATWRVGPGDWRFRAASA